MRVLICALISFGLWAQVPVKPTDGAGNERVFSAAGKVYDSTMITLPTSETAVTAVTTSVQFIHCANTTGSAVTFTLKDNQGTPKTYFAAVSVAANSVLTVHYGPIGLPMSGGIRWAAGTGSALNCQIVGVQ